MLKKITYAIVQLWYQITAPVVAWMEWQDAKHWAKEYRPAWVQFATKCKCKELRWYLEADYTPDKPAEKTVTLGLRTLRQGAKGEDVRALQILLSGRGCKGDMHEPDGNFGPNTLGAVKLFQKSANLDADGIVGKLTWSALLGVS